MTNTEIDALEAAAKAATPGPWHIKRGYCLYDERDMHVVSAWENYSGSLGLTIDSDEAMANAKFLEAANPAAILDLIEEVRQTRAERDWLIQGLATSILCPHQKPLKKECVNWNPPIPKELCCKCWLEVAKEATCQKN